MLVGCFVAVNKMSGFFENIASLVNTLFKNFSWYITQKRYERDVLEYPWLLGFVPDQYKTPGMCKRAVLENPCLLKFVLYQCTTLGMCEKAVEGNSWLLEFVPNEK